MGLLRSFLADGDGTPNLAASSFFHSDCTTGGSADASWAGATGASSSSSSTPHYRLDNTDHHHFHNFIFNLGGVSSQQLPNGELQSGKFSAHRRTTRNGIGFARITRTSFEFHPDSETELFLQDAHREKLVHQHAMEKQSESGTWSNIDQQRLDEMDEKIEKAGDQMGDPDDPVSQQMAAEGLQQTPPSIPVTGSGGGGGDGTTTGGSAVENHLRKPPAFPTGDEPALGPALTEGEENFVVEASEPPVVAKWAMPEDRQDGPLMLDLRPYRGPKLKHKVVRSAGLAPSEGDTHAHIAIETDDPRTTTLHDEKVEGAKHHDRDHADHTEELADGTQVSVHVDDVDEDETLAMSDEGFGMAPPKLLRHAHKEPTAAEAVAKELQKRHKKELESTWSVARMRNEIKKMVMTAAGAGRNKANQGRDADPLTPKSVTHAGLSVE
ncbi:unnamed protein product [Amoebophrya sp. A120]|nr:unnamed protein product [Amoebophrya sp. A120]|eukprot:GSA120T00016695001.1